MGKNDEKKTLFYYIFKKHIFVLDDLFDKKGWISTKSIHKLAVCLVASIVISLLISQKFKITTYDYKKGDIAKSNIKATIEETPPELVADIMTRGIILVGGGGMLRGLDILINEQTKMPVKLADDPLTAVARGAGIVLEDVERLKEILVSLGNEKAPQ